MGEHNTQRAYPAHWEADVVLSDGATARLRPVSPDDAQALQRMHESQSADSIFFRYFTYKSELSRKELERFTVVDYVDRVAFVILRGDELLGIGRYDRLGESADAEVAFNIADAHQGRGLGSILMEHLAAAGRENGIRRFTAEVLPENRKMLSVFQAAGFDIKRHFEDGVVAVEFPIEATARTRAVMESREHRAESRSVAELLNPECIAVIGASRQWGSIGYALLENIIEGRFTGAVYGINREAFELVGMISRPKLSEVPQQVDLAVIAVPVDEIPEVVEECAREGVRGLLVVTDGFGTGEGALDRQRALVAQARAHGMRVIGPASAGIANTDPEVSLNASVAPFIPKRGSVGVFTQSAALGASIFAAGYHRDVGFSSMISAGNRADVSGNDAMQYFEDDINTTSVGVYLESFGNPRKFSRIVRRLSHKKPVVIARSQAMGHRLPPGHSTRTTQAPAGTVTSMLNQTGAIQTSSYAEMMDVLQVLACQPVPKGARTGIIGNAPAVNRIVAEQAGAVGATVTRIDEIPGLDAEHTVDEAIESLVKTMREAAASEQVDALIIVVQSGIYQNPGDAAELAEALGKVASEIGVTTVASFTAVLEADFRATGIAGSAAAPRPEKGDSPEETNTLPGQIGLPTFASPERAVSVLAQLIRYAAWREAEEGTEIELPDLDRHRAEELVQEWLKKATGTELLRLDKEQTTQLLDCYGIAVQPSLSFDNEDEAVAAAHEFGWPVVLKADDNRLRHRLDLGGVRLNIMDEAALRSNIRQMRQVLEAYGSPGLEIQAMVSAGQGCAVLAVEDPLLGPVLSFGISGDAVDLLNDWVHMVPPLTDNDLATMIRTPRAAAKLFGYQDIPAADTDALKDLLARLAILKDDLPQVARVRFSPVLAATDSVTVLKADIDIANAAQRTDSARRALSS